MTMNYYLKTFLLFFVFWNAQKSFAYPDFISYGYNSCLVCHYNGAGGGPLNDYGRSLFALEIAQKPFFQKKLTDDEISAMSGFFGHYVDFNKLKPFAKLRYLWLDNAMDKPPVGIDRSLLMQANMGLTTLLDESEKWIINFELGYAPEPQSADPTKKEQIEKFISREYYLRWNIQEQSWLYFGFLDKVFGIRTPDHSSYSRGLMGVGQNDQVHGVLWHHVSDRYEYFVFSYLGHLQQSTQLQTKGLSSLIEFEANPERRWGFSGFYQFNDFVKQIRFAHHHKISFEKGSSWLFETGFYQDQSQATQAIKNGVFFTARQSLRIVSGLNLTTLLEYLNEDLKANNLHRTKAGIGFLYFPMQRVELSTSMINFKNSSPTKANEDTLGWQAQLHLSF